MPRLNRKLTEKEIINAKPRAKPYRLYDDGGLTLLIRPSGTKVWQYRYRWNGKENIFTVGEVGSIDSSEARRRRDEAAKLLERGLDPNQTKKQGIMEAREAAANSFQHIAEEWRMKQTWAEKHSANIKSRLEKDVYPVIGRRPIRDITVRDIIEVLRKIEGRGALDVAKRINQYCVGIFDYAIAMNLCDTNPALGRGKFIKSYEVQHRPHLKEDQLAPFFKKLEGYRNIKMQLAVKLLTLTFVRPGELRGARWEEIDWDNGIWNIPAARMKKNKRIQERREHLVPLSPQALQVLRQLQAVTGRSPFLLPGQRTSKPVSDVALIKVVKDVSDGLARPHGFRHTASTILNEQGYNGDHIVAQLAHADEDKVRSVYNKAQYFSQRKQMLEEWGTFLVSKGLVA